MTTARATQVRLNKEAAGLLRQLAAALGYYTSRGVEAGEIGNTAAMLEQLAQWYRESPDAVLAALETLRAMPVSYSDDTAALDKIA